MSSFAGFPEGKAHLTPVPEVFFNQLMPQIDHLGELKVILAVFRKLNRMEGTFRYLHRTDFSQDEDFMKGLGATHNEAQVVLDEALQRAVKRGTLLKAILSNQEGEESYYFLNSPKGRAAITAIESGKWRPASQSPAPIQSIEEPANIFRLYEENIGPLTPLIAEAIGEAEDTYPAQWIEEAIRIAVERNKRNWRYAQAILERWQQEGHHEKKENLKDRRDTAEDRRRYVEGEYSDFIEH